jgi:solute carrier family 25 carnitine/acylcarnitine transporter 20/29
MSADFWAGYVSGAAGIIIGNPLDLIKTRLQAGNGVPADTTYATAPAPQTFRGHFESTGALLKGERPLVTRKGLHHQMQGTDGSFLA